MSNVTVWGNRVFVTTHVPIQSLEEKEAVTDILGFCLDADSGKILWKVTLPGSAFISLAGGFTDGTVFVCTGPAIASIPGESDKLKHAVFEGPHPAGLVGTHIHFLDHG